MAMEYGKLFEPVLIAGTTEGTADNVLSVATTPTTRLLKGGIVRLTNTSASAVQVTLYSVPASGSASATNMCFPGKSVPANDYVDVQLPQMKAGDTLKAFAGTASVINVQAIAGAYYSA